MNLDMFIGFLLGIFVSCIICAGLITTLKEEPATKLCTIKLNDSNHASSYLTGECAQ